MRSSKQRKREKKRLSQLNRIKKKKKSNDWLEQQPTEHHIVLSSRKGGDGKNNISILRCKKHRAYHTIFENMKPDEIIKFLVAKCWNNQWEWVAKAINTKEWEVDYEMSKMSYKKNVLE